MLPRHDSRVSVKDREGFEIVPNKIRGHRVARVGSARLSAIVAGWLGRSQARLFALVSGRACRDRHQKLGRSDRSGLRVMRGLAGAGRFRCRGNELLLEDHPPADCHASASTLGPMAAADRCRASPPSSVTSSTFLPPQ